MKNEKYGHMDIKKGFQRVPRISRIFVLFLFVWLTCTVFAPATYTAAQTGDGGTRYVTIDFNDVDINLFIKYISELTGKNFIVDRTVKGKVTIISPTRISEQDAYHVFESVLEVHGFTTVPSGSVIKIIPSVQARAKSIETIMGAGELYPEDKVVTQLIPLTHSSPDEMKRMLAPLVSKTSVVIAHTDSGMLIITDFLSNINRLREIIDAVDVPSVGEELVVIPLKHASAANISKSLSQLFIKSGAKPGQKADPIKIIPYERTNSLIVFASKSNILKVRELLAKVDTAAPKGTGKIQVVYLQHASAEELVKVLTSLPEAQPAGANAAAAAKAVPVSKDVKIMADTETNSLIIIAPRDEFMVLEEVIQKLDIPRRMVYIEALIMEVLVTKTFEIGVQWGGAGTFDDGTGRVLTGFSGQPNPPYPQLQGEGNITTDSPFMPAGFTFGVLKQGVRIGNVLFPNLAAVLKAYRDDDDVNIIATPQILTTDNKEAKISVGENVPYITSANTTSALQDYTNYEYKDVTTTLDILPQINQSDLVRLDIGVEVIKLKNPNDISGTPTTLKRTANTTVVVRDEETIVIGGIIGQDVSSGQYKVPLLGDIPLLGWLFKSHTESEVKTNLFIFITPRIVENPAELAEIYYKKRDVMEYVMEGSSSIADWKHKNRPDPAHAVALVDIGFSKLQEKDYERAGQYFQQALKIDPTNPYALMNQGVVYENQGNITQAAKMYQRVVELPLPEPDEKGVAAEPDPAMVELQDRALENLLRLGIEDTRKTEPIQPPPAPAPRAPKP